MFGDSALNGFAHGGFAFWLYGGFGLLAAFLVLRFVPETKGVDSDRARCILAPAGRLPAAPAKA